MVDFASLGEQNHNTVDPMILTTPNSMITGTSAGMQQIGSPSLTVDSIRNLITVKPISTTGTQILRYGQVATGYLGMAVNDGTNDTMFAGRDNTGATVVKIAKTGFDAKTATSDQLIFNSSQDTFKIAAKISGAFSISGGAGGTTGSFTVPHTLGYAPLVFGTVVMGTNTVGFNSGDVIPLPVLKPGITGIQNSTTSLPVFFLQMAVIGTTTTNVAIGWSLIFGNNNAAGTVVLYVLQETAT